MSWSRFFTIFKYDFSYNRKRPFYWTWFILLVWTGWLMSMGSWIVRSIDTAVGTEKSWVNSEFQIAFVFALMPVMLLGLFIAIAAGTPLIRDEQQRVGEILHSTSLRPGEYIWGKFSAAMASSIAVIVLFLLTLILMNEVIPNPAAVDIHGPFHLRNYLMPTMVFFVPILFFMGGVCFALSEFTRKAFLVYLFPVALLLLAMGFLISWFPPDAGPEFTRFMQLIDPTGFRWLKQTWLIVDRGVAFYNSQNIEYDAPFLISRTLYVLFGLGMVALSQRNFVKKHVRVRDQKIKNIVATAPVAAPIALSLPEMKRERAGVLRQMTNVLRLELKELAAQPWLLVFMAMIAILLVSPDRGGEGPLHLMQIYESGPVAVRLMTPLTMMICFLILFTNTESLYRETQTGLAPVVYSTTLPTFALLMGKAIANFLVGIVAMLLSFIAVAAIIVTSREAPLEFLPFVKTWVVLILPTLLFWTGFVFAAFAFSRSRMSTYGIVLALLFVTGWAIVNDKINWVTNWPLVNTVTWSDFGSFDLDRTAFVLNRLFYLFLGVSLFAYAVFRFPRRVHDPHRSGPARSLRWKLAVAVWIALPVLSGFLLWLKLEQGFQGRAERNIEKDYWRKNLASFVNEPLPYRTKIDMDIRIEPTTRSFRMRGEYEMINRLQTPLYRIPLTGVGAWKNLHWTVNGKEYQPENRSRMFVFVLDPPLQPQQTITIGFSYDGVMLPGISRNGGPLELGEFILPAGVVLTGRNPWFVPVLGYVDSIGVDDKNRYEPRDPGPHFYEGITDAGIDRSLLQTRIRLDVPQEYFATSMGVQKEEKILNGRRILLWESDSPLRVFNVVAGKWTSKKGSQSTIYYHPRHTYNIDTMVLGLDSAREYYSKWFGRYMWKELRMSEFPAYALYARGNPTNIFFSEGIGFLTKDATDAPAAFGMSAFAITAHEAAHQWWGHMVSPGDGPGGIVLAEGMANYATLCLIQQVQGEKVRQTMAKQIEAFYGENRAVSSERPLSKSTFFRPGDVTVIYDKGSWVFWMMMNLLGRDQMFAGLTAFIQKWHPGPDHPVMEDFVADMKPYAHDQIAYDSFARQWIFDVVMPEYRYMKKPERIKKGNSWEVKALIKNVGNAKMPVAVAATSGNRLEDPNQYRESRTQITLGPGEQSEILLQCDFDPERMVVDPDINVFQLQRNAAIFRFPR